MKKNISKPLLVLLKERGLSQSDLAKKTGIGPSTISRLASGLQEASEEQVEAFSLAFDVPTEHFTQSESPIMNVHIENQHGGSTNQYSINNGSGNELIAAKEETIKALNAVITAKDEALAAKDALLASYLQERA